jgi:mono/diheme cytochrome c family protein
MKLLGLAALAGIVAACGAPPHSRSAGGMADLVIRPVAWNSAAVPIGKVRAVADTGDVVAVFADDGAAVFSAGALVARDTHIKDWDTGASIYATGGTTRWIVGTDKTGRIYRLRAMNAFEDVSARYQLNNKKVKEAAIIGPGRVVFLLEGGEVAVADANKVTIYGSSPFSAFAGGGGFGAGVTKDAVELVNAGNGLVTRFAVPDAQDVALDSRGRLYVSTKRAVYAADAGGGLTLMYDADGSNIHGLVASGDRIWFADGGELGAIDEGRISVTKGAKIAKDAKLEPSPTGDVWVFDLAALARYSTGAAPAVAAPSNWSTLIAPAFARACAQCHEPNGIAGIDLSSEAAWNKKRADIQDRVITSHTMPPEGHQLSDADRNAIHTWLTSSQ